MSGLLAVEDLSVRIDTPEGPADVLDRVSLKIGRGDITGLVGESGCGKSTLVKTILGTLPANARVTSGRVVFDGRDLLQLDNRTLEREIRGHRIGFVPQDPAQALNPLFTVGDQLLEIWRRHAPEGEDRGNAAGSRRIADLFSRVQLADAQAALKRYPHQFSGGQRQRVLIAAAMLCSPELIIADEPTTALDVTTQQQILALLAGLVNEAGLSVLFVTHDLREALSLADRVCFLSGAPGQLVLDLPIDLPRPRSADDPRILALQTNLLQQHPELLAGLASSKSAEEASA